MSSADSFELLTPVMRNKSGSADMFRLLTAAGRAKQQSIYELVKQRPCPETKLDLNLAIMRYFVLALTLTKNLNASWHQDLR